ncbi:RHS repeat-associated core domain-containing protein [Glycomyces sp. NRRL B-16210]|uniref:RHS repeat-associated core domain-containing protein n=1 Tax=Glycomyces sp. NRRL B-16210 TaxID=1463821 RepID=UPI00068C8734|nr:RHS repeat-associated core domain-containing protein [Glycomyces sp. NRRL B-16210]
MNMPRLASTVRKGLVLTVAATITVSLLVAGPAFATEFQRGPQSFASTPVSAVGAAESAFSDPAANWSGSTETAANGGDWTATDLSSAGSWSQGGSSGAYAYTYGMRVPPAAGPVPSVGLSYSSAAHDGLTSGTNNQASWIGDGWGFSPGFIERTYTACGSEDEQDGNNGEDPTGDLCWDDTSPSVTMSLAGSNTSLVLDDATGQWRAGADTNWKIEKLGSPASASAATSERWKVTGTDGTQYFFASEPDTSASRWTVPVFGNHSGEPCYKSGDFEGSRCTQAYRWMLDAIVDVHGNASRYFYGTETGRYSPALDSDSSAVSYTRSGWLKRIEYGLRADDDAVKPTGRVQLVVADRCLSDCYTTSGDPKEANWPDTPWDLDCESGTGCEQYAPVFFSTKRLVTVSAEVRNPTTDQFTTVDSWTLTHEFKDYGDESQVVLWLSSIQHTGHVGGTETMPAVEFGGTFMANRVEDGTANPAIWRPRLTSVKNETGGTVSINYSEPDCGPGDLPTNAQSNAKRCYPTWYVPEGLNAPVEAYFHKYVVTSVVETDSTGGSDSVWTFYEYTTSGGGASVLWAWNDAEFVEDDKRTYNQWRGYAQVTTLIGDPADPQPQLRSAVRYYRGLDGQPLPNGNERSVTLTSTRGDSVTDHEALAGQVWEQIAYDGSTVIASTTTRYWTKNTATRVHDGGELKAWMSAPNRVDSQTKLSATAWRTTRATSTFDDYGRSTAVSSLGNLAVSGDEQCVRTYYADNTAKWILTAPSRIETVSVACNVTASRPDDVVTDVRSYYDGLAFGAAPTRALMTKSETLTAWDGGPVYATLAESTFDDLGRAVSSTDALGAVSTVVYTPSGAGPVTGVSTTNALGHTDSATYEPAWGAMVSATGVNGATTTVAYDSLGRRTAVWLPGQSQSAGKVPNLKFSYTVSDTAPSAVTTETMIWDQSYLTQIALFDALLRPRQSQADTYGGRLVTQTVYDSRGQVAYTSGANFNNDSGPTEQLVRISRSNDIARSEYVYDAAGRVTDQVYVVKDEEQWRTTTAYGGHDTYWQTTVTPPEGASAAAGLSDALGRTVELRQFHGNTPTGAFDATTYDYTAAGRLETVTDPVGNAWSFAYDLRGRKVAADDPDTGHSTVTYNVAGQVVATTSATEETLAYEYDVLGRRTAVWEDAVGTGTILSEWTYDTAVKGIGLPHTATNWIDGQAWTDEVYEYDAAGRPIELVNHLPDGAGALEGEYWQVFSYHPDGSVRTSRANGIGSLRPETMRYHYNDMGQPSRVIGESPDFGSVKVYVDAAVYSPYGQLLQRRLGDPADVGGTSGQAWQTWIYEEGTGRLAEFYFDKDTAGDYDGTNYGIAALSYEYDDAGNILSITDEPVHTSEALAPETQCFQYDHHRRLTEAWSQAGTGDCASTPSTSAVGGPAAYWSSYDYDLTGNRTGERRWNGIGQTDYEYAFPAEGSARPHALTEVTSEANGGERTIFTYDASGFTTSIDRDGDLSLLDWTPTGRLDTVANGEDTTRFVDNAQGSRIARIDPDGGMTAWVAGYELRYDAATSIVQATRYYTHGGSVIAVRVGKGDIQFLSGDHHGTGQWIVNGNTLTTKVRRYDPFGNDRSGTAWVERDGTYGADTWPDERGFIGGIENKGIGLTTIGAREYDPMYGRFISVDPIADYDNPQQLNGYAYALNNPVSFSDPSGLSPVAPQPGMIPDWCGGSPVTCTGWHWPDEIGGSSSSGGTNSGYSGPGGDNDGDGWTPWNEWTPSNQGLDSCMDDHGWNYSSAGMKVFGTCLPPLPVDAAKDADTFVFYCLWYGMHGSGGDLAFCGKAGAFAGFDIDSGVEPQTVAEFTQTILDLTIIGDIQDCTNGQLSGCGWAAADLFGGKVIKWGGDLWTAMRKAQKACNSFIAGTLVLMADGTSKPIEEVEAGEEVLSVDIVTGEVVAAVVADTMTTPEQLRNLVTIGIDTDGGGTADAEITATTDHAFWATGLESESWAGISAEWTAAQDLETGAWLHTSEGTWAEVTAVGHQFVYIGTHSLSVAYSHTHFVLAAHLPILVHNQVCGKLFEGNGLQHVLNEHVIGSPGVTAGNTTFADWSDMDDIMELIQDAASTPGRPNTPDPRTGLPRDGTIHTLDFEYPIGSNGETIVEVILNSDGTLRTAYPKG